MATALIRFLCGKLRLSREKIEIRVHQTGRSFQSFRRIESERRGGSGDSALFSVQFRFARLSEKQNRIASVLPMLMIAGFPGFRSKIYFSDETVGVWMGLYAWSSRSALEAYRHSLVYRVMKRRAVPGSVLEIFHEETQIDEAIAEWQQTAYRSMKTS